MDNNMTFWHWLGLLFIALKLTGNIDWNLGWVLSPLIAVCVLQFLSSTAKKGKELREERMKFYKCRYLKGLEAVGKNYIFKSEDDYKVGDLVKVEGSNKGVLTDAIVTSRTVDREEIEALGTENIKTIV